MKRVHFNSRCQQPLHIEVPGCIINVRLVTDAHGQTATAIEIMADGNRYSGDPEWWIDAQFGNANQSVRVVQTKVPR